MAWKGEGQRHSLAARGIRTGQYIMSAKGKRPDFVKTSRGGVLRIPIKTKSAQDELFSIEKKMLDMGISFDSGYILDSRTREWFLDYVKGAQLINGQKNVDVVFDLQLINVTDLKRIEERLERLDVKMNVIWEPENNSRTWRFRQ